MRTAKITYNAPDGDSKVVEMNGVTFFDGKEIEVNSDDNPALFSRFEKMAGNDIFDVEIGEDQPRPKRGRPSNADKAKAADAPKGVGEPSVLGGTGTSPKPEDKLADSKPSVLQTPSPVAPSPAEPPKAG